MHVVPAEVRKENGDVDGCEQPCRCWELYLFFKRVSSVNCWAIFPVPRALLLNYVHMCVSVGGNVHVTTGAPGGQKKPPHFLRVEVTGGFKPPDWSAGNWIWDFCKSSRYFYCLQCRSIMARLSFHPQGQAFYARLVSTHENACLSLSLPSGALKVVHNHTLGFSAPHLC